MANTGVYEPELVTRVSKEDLNDHTYIVTGSTICTD